MFKIVFGGVYALFLLASAAILYFGGAEGRRHFVVSLCVGVSVSFFVRFLYPGMNDYGMILLQALCFPFIVLASYGTLFLIARFRRR